MKEIEVKQRPFGAYIDIELSNGESFRIEVNQEKNYIVVNGIDTAICIEPNVSNQVKIRHTNS